MYLSPVVVQIFIFSFCLLINYFITLIKKWDIIGYNAQQPTTTVLHTNSTGKPNLVLQAKLNVNVQTKQTKMWKKSKFCKCAIAIHTGQIDVSLLSSFDSHMVLVVCCAQNFYRSLLTLISTDANKKAHNTQTEKIRRFFMFLGVSEWNWTFFYHFHFPFKSATTNLFELPVLVVFVQIIHVCPFACICFSFTNKSYALDIAAIRSIACVWVQIW